MKEWFRDKDYLNTSNEKIIGEDLSQKEIVKMITKDTGI